MGEQIKMSGKEFRDKISSREITYDQKGKLHWKTKPVEPADKKKKTKKSKPEKIDLFCKLIKQEFNLDCIREFQFDPNRKWRADYYIKEINCCIECEGGVFARQKGEKSRHFNGTGILNDMIKYNRTTEMGYKLIRVQPSELLTKGFNAIERIINGQST